MSYEHFIAAKRVVSRQTKEWRKNSPVKRCCYRKTFSVTLPNDQIIFSLRNVFPKILKQIHLTHSHIHLWAAERCQTWIIHELKATKLNIYTVRILLLHCFCFIVNRRSAWAARIVSSFPIFPSLDALVFFRFLLFLLSNAINLEFNQKSFLRSDRKVWNFRDLQGEWNAQVLMGL